MKSILVLLSYGPQAGQNLFDALSAIMVLATFGHQVKVCLIDDAVTLSNAHSFNTTGFKSAYAILQSFEFYDLLPIGVEHLTHSLVNGELELEHVTLNADFIHQFDQVVTW